ncbi:hypothetical protein [Brevibacillus porteri]|uniref:hypothetical protein n=1 Tax=Brevibacillus TaxID=55080 RepID=UPI001304E3A6|nr:hypothetical protein [Brevibacillus porteri]MED1800645.1 hypothetical protein [Brevibacillus porteri]MED2134727.1 hypothetical protein [Brevibacillus porteri]MED2745616.1 hypothetical protein [Brevibacillus porteri]MED2814746.1 hypothetical protein [Brevibacillus porteri]MED2896320.1 hypothetical protein [Brevibacillus porteri]
MQPQPLKLNLNPVDVKWIVRTLMAARERAKQNGTYKEPQTPITEQTVASL